jgi:beta-lactamase regulating signal transducer with metallopeptidase domain
MSLLLQSLASEEWDHVIKALLHTLWLGGLAAGGLYFVLRGKVDPVARYRWCVGALLAVVLGGIVAWAALQQRPAAVQPSSAGTPTKVAAPPSGAVASSPTDAAAMTAEPMAVAEQWRWTPWLALIWLGGMAAMLARTGSLVARAEKLRRRSRPLESEAVLKLIEEARRKLGLVRRIQVVITEQLTSPAVMGLLSPILIMPLSMVTTLPTAQLQLILLHELAHIRRGDYLVNLCQLLAESLLFFNPAVWWISRQIRQEREACCDAVAIALAGERLQYAQALANVAGEALAGAPAFGDRRNPSGLKDRIQRLLVPGYRPALRLTWCALLAAFFVGGGLLFLSAIGTRVAVAAILSPQQRIERIAKKMTEAGQKSGAEERDLNAENWPRVKLSGRVRLADGSPVPEWVNLLVQSSINNSSYGTVVNARNGFFTNSIREGTIFLGAEVTGFAPACLGPLDGLSTNRLENLEIILQRGFDTRLQLVDAEDGKPVADAKVATMFLIPNSGFQSRYWNSGADGIVTLTHCTDLPMNVTVNAPGYEITQETFDHIRAGQPLRAALRRGVILGGVVLDKVTGQPVAGAELHLLSLLSGY